MVRGPVLLGKNTICSKKICKNVDIWQIRPESIEFLDSSNIIYSELSNFTGKF